MFNFSQELLKAQEIERIHLSNLESRLALLSSAQREQITEMIEQMKSRGVICSEYDFV